jgi:hypothetical protein
MEGQLFTTLIFIPSVALCYVALTTFYGPRVAYIAISWIPLALLLVLLGLERFDSFSFGGASWNLAPYRTALAWTSLAQAAYGVGVLAWAASKREPWRGVALAVVITAVPFFVLRY